MNNNSNKLEENMNIKFHNPNQKEFVEYIIPIIARQIYKKYCKDKH